MSAQTHTPATAEEARLTVLLEQAIAAADETLRIATNELSGIAAYCDRKLAAAERGEFVDGCEVLDRVRGNCWRVTAELEAEEPAPSSPVPSTTPERSAA